VTIQSGKILIADDEFLIRWSLTQALSQEGYEVTSVEDGRKAIEAAKVQHFDFIITDLIMPELDGWEVLKMATQSQPQPRVIIITAKGTEDTGRIAKEKGAWAYVEKPYIIDKIKAILGGPQRRFRIKLNFPPFDGQDLEPC
jgi:DNA-binding NtrC family response regulator